MLLRQKAKRLCRETYRDLCLDLEKTQGRDARYYQGRADIIQELLAPRSLRRRIYEALTR